MYLENVREFLSLCKHGSFVDAAEHSFVSQSSFTKHLKDMEAELGTLLFERTTRSVVLTQSGKKLIAFATDMLAEWEAFFKDTGSSKPRYDIKTIDLRRFVVLCENGSFTKAARDLDISQATLTQTVKRLEKLLEHPLIERSTHGMTLCPAGELLLRRAQKIIRTETNAGFCVKNMLNRGSSMLRIGIDPAAVNSAQLDKILSALAAVPDLDVTVCEEDSDALLTSVKDGFFDVAVIMTASATASDRLYTKRLCSTGFSVFHNRGPMTAEELFDISLCLWKQNTVPYQEALRRFRGGTRRIHIHYCGSDMNKLAGFIRRGFPALLPRTAIDANAAIDELPVFDGTQLHISVAAKKDHPAELTNLIDIIETAYLSKTGSQN